jgi:hypothetical protein
MRKIFSAVRLRGRTDRKHQLLAGGPPARAVILAVAILALGAASASASVTGAVSTTDNPLFVDSGGTYTDQACLNGHGVNCNIYQDKRDVWLSGLPVASSLGAGTYFFAVLVPGGQPDPNDGSPNNLSDTTCDPYTCPATNADGSPIPSGDSYTNRTFTVDGSGSITSYVGTHSSNGNKLQLFPYDDTTNPGGVYIVAVCSLANGYPVKASDCKYDAFKVNSSQTTCQSDCGGQPVADLTVVKNAGTALTRSYTWGIQKSVVGSSHVDQVGGTVTFNYSIGVTRNAPVDSAWTVAGDITVFNPNAGDANSVNVTDQLDDTGANCVVSDGTPFGGTAGSVSATNGTVPGETSVDYPYTCTYGASGPANTSQTNTATATWDQTLSDGSTTLTGTGPGMAAVDWTSPTITGEDECATITDAFNGGTAATLGTPCGSTTYQDSQTITVKPGCVNYPNVASFVTTAGISFAFNAATPLTGSSTASVRVCGPSNTGALTIGFWKNTNGNTLIKDYCAPANKKSLATYLSGLGAGAGPFSDAALKTCSGLVTYVNGIISGATATNMNVMLKAQMLATALDVYFSDPSLGFTTTSVSKTKQPSSFFTGASPLGSFVMDLTAICPMVDNTTAGTATCQAGASSTNGFASGAFPWPFKSVQAILDFAATVGPSPWTIGAYTGSNVWYGANRTLQTVLKNTFDQINNQDAFTI